MGLSIIILAAGEGTRMRSALPKVLQSLAKKPLLGHVVDCARQLAASDICVVYGFAGDAVQAAFADLGAAQCGYCTPGMLMAAKALLVEHVEPSSEQIRAALAGNLCRCTGYHKIVEAVEWAAALMRGDAASAPPREAFYGAALPGED